MTDDRGYLWWLGGFFDGEGCVSIPETKSYGRSPYDYTLTIEVGGNFKEVLEEMQRRYGGTLTPKPRSDQGWRLQLSPNPALRFLETIQPYVRLKWEEVEIGITFQRGKVRLTSGTPEEERVAEMIRREKLAARLRFLNHVRNVGRPVEKE